MTRAAAVDSREAGRAVTVRVARWSATHPWRAILMWLAFVAAAVSLAATVPAQQLGDDEMRVGESGRADAISTDAGLADAPVESVLVTDGDEPLDRDLAEAVTADLRTGMQRLPGVASVAAPVWSADGAALLVPIEMTDPAGDEAPDAAPLQSVTAEVQRTYPELRVEQAGEASLDAAIWERVGEDLSTSERISLPITFGVLLLTFGALIAAGIPVLLALSGIAATMGLYAPLSYLVPDGGTVANLVLLIGLAVGVDYSLFYLKREREERRLGRGTVDAIEVAAATSGHSVVVSGLAVVVAMTGLFFAQDPTFSSMAVGTILVVVVTVLGSLTVLPAVLAKLGRFVDRPRVPLLWRATRRIGPGGISRRVLNPVLRHPKAALAVSGLVVGALCVPALGMQLKDGGLNSLPQDLPEVATMQRIGQAFPAEGTSYEVVVRTSPQSLGDARAALLSLERRAQAGGNFTPVPGTGLRTSPESGVAVLTLAAPVAEGSAASTDLLAELRTALAPAALDRLDGLEWAVGGTVAEYVDGTEQLSDALPWVLTFVLGLTMVMMVVTFRSVVLGAVTTVLNLASVGAAYGVLALVFQHTWAESLLGFTSTGHVVPWMPLFLFVILVGLSMDYHVFVLSRIREGVRRGLPHRRAIESGITETAGVVASAAAVMVTVFGSFAAMSMIEMKQLGVGLAVAVLIDATLIRVVMLPSMLALLGRATWWPSRVAERTDEPLQVAAPSRAILAR